MGPGPPSTRKSTNAEMYTAGMAKRTGRRPGTSTAKDDILAAARDLFAVDGYDKASIRAIAERAGVDVALVSYYYGSKRGLFVAAMAIPIDPSVEVLKAVQGPRDGIGDRLIHTFVGIWEGEQTGPAFQTMLRSIAAEPVVAKTFGEFASDAMLPMLAESAGVSVETGRVVVGTVFGLAFMRYVVGAPTFVALTAEQVVAQYGPALQRLIDAD